MSSEDRVQERRALVTATLTEVGRRSRNEDRLGTAEASGVHAWMVCDGLGGHDNGDLAAEAAVGAALRALATPAGTLVETAETMIRSANEAVIAARAERGGESGAESLMASTISLVVSDGSAVAWAHAGDSRIFRFRSGNGEQVMRDHTIAESMRALSNNGRREEESQHATQLLSSLGTTEMYYDVSALEPLEAGDVFLIASDGLWGAVPLRTMVSELHAASSLEAWLAGLRDRVERRRDPDQDNFTGVAFGADLQPGATLGGRASNGGWRALFGWL